ncbi:MAG: hypothetical protein HOI95_10090 [Chromatiales bacterium]|jgi:hypothetical protein|nr:hypothetical protein [Chromatiales bacterium]
MTKATGPAIWLACLGGFLASSPLDAAPLTRDPDVVAELVSLARTDVQVRVIVELRLVPGAEVGEGQAVAQAQQRLLAELAPFRVEVLRSYSSLPMLTLQVGPVGLGYLLGSDRVANIFPDRIASTQLPQSFGGPVWPESATPGTVEPGPVLHAPGRPWQKDKRPPTTQ